MLHPSKDQLRLLGVIAIMSVITTAILIVVVVAVGNNGQRNHDAQLCTIEITHQLSTASGKPPAEARATFNVIFTEQWLEDNCRLTPEEARSVLSNS